MTTRLGLAAGAMIAGCAVVVALVSADASAGELGPPELVPAPIRLAVLFLLPAVVAAMGALRRSRPILTAAGVLSLAQSFVAFSGVTIPFLVPAVVLLALGARNEGTSALRRAKVGGALVVLLGLAMWVALFATTETTCWVAEPGADGQIVYRHVPETQTQTLGPTEVASGCDGGSVTLQGVALATLFWIGAVVVAASASNAPAAGNEGAPRS